jgi:PIN domain
LRNEEDANTEIRDAARFSKALYSTARRRSLSAMQYDALTLDANIFHRSGFYLEGGLLGQLSQFKEGSTQFILSEIVLREVDKYLKIEAKEARIELEKAIKKSSRNVLFSSEVLASLESTHSGIPSAEASAKARLDAFVVNTGAQIVPADQTDIKELLQLYFAPSPPFEASGKKKHEFPDAIALLSLEAWAKSNDLKILAISDDGGWSSFADTSEFIDVEKDLAVALQKLQGQAAQARAIVSALLADFDAGTRPELLQAITDGISDAVESLAVEPVASAAYQCEAEMATLTYDNFRFLRDDDQYELAIVQIGKDKIVAKIDISITATASADFDFVVWDSVDKQYVPIGSTLAKTDAEFEAATLITFEADFASADPEIEISNVELIDAINSVDFDFVDMDHSDDRHERD